MEPVLFLPLEFKYFGGEKKLVFCLQCCRVMHLSSSVHFGGATNVPTHVRHYGIETFVSQHLCQTVVDLHASYTLLYALLGRFVSF